MRLFIAIMLITFVSSLCVAGKVGILHSQQNCTQAKVAWGNKQRGEK